MLSADHKMMIREIFDSGYIDYLYTEDWTPEQKDYLNSLRLEKENMENKMDKFIVAYNCLAIPAKTLEEAKSIAKEMIDEYDGDVYIYELKLKAGVEKPKVEFKEV